MAEVLAKTTFSSVIHNNEVCDEIVNGAMLTVILLRKQNYKIN